MQFFNLVPNETEKLSVMVRNPMDTNRLPLRISIANDKEQSKTEANNATEKVKVFADGSEINGKLGAAAVLLRQGKPPRVLHFHLGDASEHDAVFDLRGGEPLIQTNFDPGRDRNGADVPTLAIKINNGPVVISLLKVA